jgi:predicted ferric reductase
MSKHLRTWAIWLPVGMAVGGLVAAASANPTDIGAPPGDQMTTEHMWWYMGRAGGFVAFWLLFGSVALGLAVSSRFFDGLLARPWVYEMHQFLSLIVIVAILFHALVLLPDPYANFRLEDIFLPLHSSYRPAATAAGIVTLYGLVVVSASFYVKKHIGGQNGWRLLHYTTFLLFLGALVHGLFAGTDSRETWAQYMYLGSGLAVLFLAFFRILASRRAEKKSQRAPAASPATVTTALAPQPDTG